MSPALGHARGNPTAERELAEQATNHAVAEEKSRGVPSVGQGGAIDPSAVPGPRADMMGLFIKGRSNELTSAQTRAAHSAPFG
jgi:hypothetical protein